MVHPRDLHTHFHNTTCQHYVGLFGQGGLAHFKGTATQKGQGFIGDLIKFAIPVLTKAAPHVLKGVSRVIKDVRKRRKPLKKSVKEHGLQALKEAAKTILEGRGKSPAKRKPRKRKAPTKQKLSKDMFF